MNLTKAQAWDGITLNTSEVILVVEINEDTESCVVVNVNPAIGDLSGYDPEELLGQDFSILLPEPARPRHFSMMMAAKEKKAAGGKLGAMRGAAASAKNKVRLRRKDGRLTPITATIGFFDHGTVSYAFVQIQDDTDRTELEDTLISERDRLGMLLTMGEIGLWTWNASSARIDVSETWLSMVGYEQNERADVQRMIKGLASSGAREFQQFNLLIDWWSKRLHPDDVEHAQTTIEQFLLMRSSEPYRNLYRYRRQDGTYISISSQGQAIWDSETGALKSLFIAQVPVTEMAAANRDLQTQLAEAANANRELAEQLQQTQKQQSLEISAMSKQLAPLLPLVKWGLTAVVASTTLLSDKAEDVVAGVLREGGEVVRPVESVVNPNAEIIPELLAQEPQIKKLLADYKGDASAAVLAVYSNDETGAAYGQIIYQSTQGGEDVADREVWKVSGRTVTASRHVTHENNLAHEIDAPASNERGLSRIAFQYSLPIKVKRWSQTGLGNWKASGYTKGFVALETRSEPKDRQALRERTRRLQADLTRLFENYSPGEMADG